MEWLKKILSGILGGGPKPEPGVEFPAPDPQAPPPPEGTEVRRRFGAVEPDNLQAQKLHEILNKNGFSVVSANPTGLEPEGKLYNNYVHEEPGHPAWDEKGRISPEIKGLLTPLRTPPVNGADKAHKR